VNATNAAQKFFFDEFVPNQRMPILLALRPIIAGR
jgi:hypothetical protein